MTHVYVLTDAELGWDCVVGAYSSLKLAEYAAAQRGGCCNISEQTIETETSNRVETCFRVIKNSLNGFEIGEEVYLSRFDFTDDMHEYTSFNNKDKKQWLYANEVEEIDI